MAQKSTIRILALLALLLTVLPGRAQNNPANCSYTIELQDGYWNSFYGGVVYLCDATGTPFDTVAFGDNGQGNDGNSYSRQFTAPAGDVMLWYQDTVTTAYWELVNREIRIYDSEGTLLSNRNCYDALNSESTYYDTVEYRCPTCFRAMDVMLASVDSTTATLTWLDTLNPGATYLVEYGMGGFAYDNSVVVQGSQVTLAGLEHDMYYQYRIRTLCGTGDTSTAATGSFNAGPLKVHRLYVRTDVPDGTNQDGLTWASAFTNFWQAIDVFSAQVDYYDHKPEIWVAGGTYNESFELQGGMHIYGGLAGNEGDGYDMSQRDFDAHATILNCSGHSYGVYCYTSFEAGNEAFVDGFTIQGAYTGAYLQARSSLRNCTVRNCSNHGVSVSGDYSNRTLALQNCRIENNVANSSYLYGIGVRASGVIIENCLIVNNRNSYNDYGAGIYSDGSVTLRHCDIVGNSCRYYGGGFFQSSDSLINCIVWNNTSSSTDAQFYDYGAYFLNSAVPQSVNNGEGTILLSTRNWGGAGENYPNFVNAETGDYRLNAGSACIDAGATVAGIATDLAGNSRVMGQAADMGCYESDGTLFCGTPFNVDVASRTTESVTLAWESSGSTQFEVQYADGDGSWIMMIGVDGFSASITGLAEFAYGRARVRSVCNGEYSEWSDEISFRSGCNNPLAPVRIGSNNYNYAVAPVYTEYPWSASCMLLTAAEVGSAPRAIDTVGFTVAWSNFTGSRHLTLSVARTALQQLEAYSDMPDVEWHTCFEGDVAFSGSSSGDIYLPLQTPIAYDADSNLLVKVVDNTGMSTSSLYFYVDDAQANTLYFYGDSEQNYSNGSLIGSRPVIYLSGSCDLSSCPQPVYSVSGVTDTSATIAFERIYGNAEVELIRLRDSAVTTLHNLEVVNNTLTIGGLSPYADYAVSIRSVCSVGDTSLGTTGSFRTAPADLPAYYVKQGATGVADGSSWNDAFNSLYEALEAADEAYARYGGTKNVYVAAGTYYCYNENTHYYQNYVIPAGVSVYGGFAGTETGTIDLAQRDFTANATILDGQYNGRVVYYNSYYGGALDGFTLQNGSGRAAYLYGPFVLRNCVVKNSYNYDNGGGIYASYGVTIDNCVVDGCYTSYGDGGGIYAYNSSVVNTVVKNCRAGRYGGNSAGGVYLNNSYMENCLLVNDTSYYQGALWSTNSSRIVNSDVVRNVVTSDGACAGICGNSNTQVTNSIVWGNHSTDGEAVQMQGVGTVTYSAIQDGWSGEGNITLDSANFGSVEGVYYPLFSDPDHGDFTLQATSPCVDAGLALEMASSTDAEGNARVFNDMIDMGCYENSDPTLCLRPQQPTVSSTGTNAMVSWTMPEGALSVELAYKASTDNDWTVVSGLTGTRHFLTDLTRDEDYSVRLRSLCDANEYSSWSRELVFSTRCTPWTLVGDETPNGTISNFPIRAYYGNSYSQQLFKSDEVGPARQITGLRFQYTSSELTRNVKVYLGHTDLNNFSGYAALNGNELTQVYDGSLTFSSDTTWTDVTFQTPFAYNGSSNLVVAFMDVTGSSTYSYYYFGRHSTSSSYSTLYISSSSAIGLDNTSWNSSSYRNNIVFVSQCDTGSCAMPMLQAGNVTDSSARLVCQTGSGNVVLQYRAAGSDTWTSLTAEEEQTLGNLRQNTSYEVRACTVCGVGDSSAWNVVGFTTSLRLQESFYVKSVAAGTGDGTSWANAMSSLDEAINTAAAVVSTYNRDASIYVAQGTYYGTFPIREGVSLYGGFVGNEPDNYDLGQRDFGANATVIDAQNTGAVFSQSSEFYGTHSTVIDGFTLRNGLANANGGAVLMRQGTALRNSVVQGSSSIGSGGGICNYSGTIENVVVENCNSANNGGGIYSNNGHLKNVTVRNCYTNNYANAGAIYSYYDTIVSCTFTGDSSYNYAAYFNSSYVENSLFYNNVSRYNSIIYAGYSTLVGCDVVNNRTNGNNYNAVEGGNSNIKNTVVWGNRSTNGTINSVSTSIGSVTYSAITGGFTGTGNISLEQTNDGAIPSLNYPLFVDPETGNFTLQPTSPLVNGGLTELALKDNKDLDGRVRVFGDTIDIGCYEYDGTNACVRPSYLNVVANTSAATLNWPVVATAQGYEVQYRLAGADAWTSIADISNNYYMLSPLEGDTAYEARVRSLCGNEGNSPWSSVATFATRCVSTVQIGDPTSSATSEFLPSRIYYEHSYTQQLYTAAEMGGAGTLTSIQFKKSSDESDSRHLAIYLAETTQSAFTSSNDAVAGSAFTRVFNGTVNTVNGWFEIPFDTPYGYTGNNLVLAVLDSTGSYPGSRYFTVFGDALSLFSFRDGTPYDLNTNPGFSSTNGRNVVIFGKQCDNSECAMPLVSTANITDSSATLLCQTGLGVGQEMQYRQQGADSWVTLTPLAQQVLGNLKQNSAYEVRMRTLCGTGDASEWSMTTFTTLPRFSPVIYVADAPAGRADGSSWSNATNDLTWAMSTATASKNLYHNDVNVWVAHGTYYGNFQMVPSVNVYGGFAGNEATDYDLGLRDFATNASVLDAQNSGRVLNQGAVFTQATASVWDGFTLQNGYVTGNNNGGGAYLRQYGTLSNAVVKDCYAYYGGGVYNNGGTLKNSTIEGDSATVCGGIYNESNGNVENCLVANNAASTNTGYAIYMYSGTLRNVTVVNNRSTSSETSPSAVYRGNGQVYNSIIWGNRSASTSDGDLQTNATASFYYCAIEGKVYNEGGSNTISLDSANTGNLYSPCFVQPTAGVGRAWRGGDWRLAAGSVCANRGLNGYVVSATDLDGTARVKNDTVDMGCYESNLNKSYLPTYDSVIFVKTVACGAADGTSWDNALADISRAQQIAAMNQVKKVWVAEGTYHGGFEFVPSVSVYGGFAGNEASNYDISQRDLAAHATILDGGDSLRVLSNNTGYSYSSTGVPTWDGFIIQHGYSTSSGGGVYLTNNTRLANSTVRNCYTTQGGGGVYIGGGSLVGCTIVNDSARYAGGGVYLGGGTMENCLVANNSSRDAYAGVYVNYGTMRSSTVVNNASYSDNSTVYGVYVYDYYYYNSNINNNIIWGNRAMTESSSMQQMNVPSNNSTITNNAVEGGIGREGNYVLASENDATLFAPRFVQPTEGAGASYTGGDWHLQEGSVCINHGNNGYTMETTDLEGNSRIQRDTVDMGCYESPYSGVRLPEYGSIVYVKPVATGNGDGTSWDNAIADINVAQRLASSFGADTVWVAAGTYYGDTTSLNAFTMTAGVKVFGGFVGNEAPGYDLGQRDLAANATVLDGQQLRRVLYQPTNFSQSNEAVWNGFTIQNGRIFANDNVGGYGAGVYMRQYSTLENCTIADNMNLFNNAYGGGVYMEGTTYSRNIDGNYVTFYSTRLVNCKVLRNSSRSYGGGVYARGALVSNCLVADNSATAADGGGIYVDYDAYIVNTTIVDNSCSSSSSGGGICCGWYGGNTVRNSIVWGNKSGLMVSNIYNSGSAITFYNSASEDDMGSNATDCITIASTNDGNDPTAFYARFNDPTTGDWSLHPTSSLLDISDSTDYYFIPSVDLAGNPRWNGMIDLGCYEGTFNNNCPPVVAMTASNVTSSQATVSWNTTGSETQWAVRYRIEGETDEMNLVANDSTITLTDLTINRTYVVYVRSICGDGSMSAWSVPVSFTTLCDTASLTPLSAFTSMLPDNNSNAFTSKVDFSWSSLAEATSYDFYLWLDGDDVPTTPTRSHLTTPGVAQCELPNYDNLRGSTFHWYVVAWNECISRNSDTFAVKVPYLPNLHVSGFTMGTPVANQQVNIEWTVVNDGQGPTPPGATWSDYIWITSISAIGGGFLYDVDEVLLATVPNLQALEPGQSYTNSTTIQIPRDNEGNKFFFVFADQYSANNIDFSESGAENIPIPYEPSNTGYPYHYFSSQTTSYPGNFIHSQMKETNESDNFFYKNVTVLPPPTPDLKVTNIVHPLNANSADSATFTWQTTNQGDAAAVAGSWNDAVYLSAEETFNYNTATLMGTASHSGGLAIGESYTASVRAQIPEQFSGTYYVYVLTDIDNNEYENIYEANNTSVSDQTMNIVMSAPADLQVDSIGTVPDILSACATYPVAYKVTNVGARAVSDRRWYDAVYLSNSETFSPATAKLVGRISQSRDLGIGESYVATINIRIPDSTNSQHYLFVKSDIDDAVFEYTYEENNVMRRAEPVLLATPDLQPVWIALPDTVNSSQPFTVRWSVKNVGQGDLVSRSMRSSIKVGNTTIYTSSLNAMTVAAGDSVIESAVVRLACGTATSVQLTLQADYSDIVFESLETNNSANSPAMQVVAPDLGSTLLATEGELWSGTEATVSWTLTNSGNAAVNDTITDNFFLAEGTALTNASAAGSYRRLVTLAPGESIVETAVITLPNGVSGTLRLHQVVNADGRACEGANSTDNHVYTDALTVGLSPYPDLTVSELLTQSSYNIGETFLLDYTVANGGTGSLNNQEVTTKFYLTTSTSLNTSNATQIGSDVQRLTIPVGESTTVAAMLRVPTNTISGSYYIFAVTDATNAVYEHTGEDNNTTRSARITLNEYPLDLAATNLAGSSAVEWGGSYTYTLTVSNNSTMPSLASSWVDRLYLSTDEQLQSSDQQLAQVYRRQEVAAGGSYTVSFPVNIPMGTATGSYLIAVVDAGYANPDMNIGNNMVVLPLTVSSVPTADLAVSNVEILTSTVLSGQSAQVAYTVTNVSDVDIVDASWTDKVFLSANSTYESSDEEVGSITKRNFSLAAGASYTDTATFRVPLPQNGTMFLIARTNSGNNFYETNTANNLIATSMNVALPQPGDLVVTDVFADDTVFSGRYLHLQWSVKNIGENTLSGNGLRTLAYISANNTFDNNDRLIGNIAVDNVMLAPGAELHQQTACRISGLPEGSYYIIVKTDVANAFNEVNDTNNSTVSGYTTLIQVRNLPFNTPLADTILNNLANDFKLNVGDHTGETVRIHLDAADTVSGAVNMLYVSYNNIGSDLNYTYSTIGQFTHSPEIYIPSTQMGYYGINVIGSTPTDTMQAVNLQADILPFELRGVNPTEGGNTGKVTVELTGSRFRPDMQVWMRSAGDTLRPDTLIYDSYYRAFATFDLKGADTGWYNVGVVNYCEGEAVLNNAFHVVPGTPDNLATNLIMPASPRPNRTVVLLLEFGNIGTTDIDAPVVELESVGGSYISLTNEGLSEHLTTLQIPLQVQGDVGYTIRPGATGSVNIYCHTVGVMVFSIKRVH